jgi:hypothetical protein
MAEERETDPRPVLLARPPKPVSEMTEAELDDWAEAVYEKAVDAMRRNR